MARELKEDDGRLNLRLDMSDPQQKMVKEFLNLLVRKKSEYISALVLAHLKEVGISDVSLLSKVQAKEIMHDAIMKSISQNGITRFITANEQVNMAPYSFPAYPVRGGLNNEDVVHSGFRQQLSGVQNAEVQNEAPKQKEDINTETAEHKASDSETNVEGIQEISLTNDDEEIGISDEVSSIMDEWG